MDECNAALVLMSLSCSPNSPRNLWETRLGSSPGSNSSASWSTGSSSPPLSDDGQTHVTAPPTTNINSRRGPRTASLSASDEGIVMDYNEDLPRKRRVSRTFWFSFYLFIRLSASTGFEYIGPIWKSFKAVWSSLWAQLVLIWGPRYLF